jgi:hypothetical protein
MASIVVAGDTSGSVTLSAPSVSGSTVLTLPTSSGTLVVTGGAQTIEFADGSAAAPSITNSGDTNTGMFFPAADTIAFTEGGVESMRIDASGNVGIGTSSPSTYGKFVTYSSGGYAYIDTNGHIWSYQLLDVATAGGRLTGGSSQGVLGEIAIEQTTTGAKGGYIRLNTCASGSNTATERMRITAAGYVTQPFQPAFLATSTGAITPGSGLAKISFASVGPNISSSFSTATSRFTAPIAGTYSFTAIITYGTEGSASYVGAIFYKNGGNILSTYNGKASGQYSQVKNNLVATLSAGDYIELYTDTNSGSVIYEGGRTYLMGYLLG